MSRTQTMYHRQGNKRVAKRLWGCVNPKDSIRIRVVITDTAKHFIIPTETLFVEKICIFCL